MERRYLSTQFTDEQLDRWRGAQAAKRAAQAKAYREGVEAARKVHCPYPTNDEIEAWWDGFRAVLRGDA
jgi:ribosome modulation factor